MLRDTPIILAKKWGGLENVSQSHWGIDLMNLHDDIAIGLPLLQGPLLWGLFLHRNLCWLYHWTSGAWSIRIFGGQAAIWDHCQGCRGCHCWFFSSSSCGLILCSQAMMEQTVWTQSFFAGVFFEKSATLGCKIGFSTLCQTLSVVLQGLWLVTHKLGSQSRKGSSKQTAVHSIFPKKQNAYQIIPIQSNTFRFYSFCGFHGPQSLGNFQKSVSRR